MAVNRQYKDATGDTKKQVDFFDVVAWGKLGEIISQYGGKGQGVHVVGRLQNRSWESQDGSKRNKTEIIANDISLVGGKGSGSDTSFAPVAEGVDAPAPEEAPAGEDEIDINDIPF
jgi:single-strand DNA-binding protein